MAKIIFVDKDDNIIGAGTKQEAVEKGIVHRIVRIFLYNAKGEMLIQRRGELISSMPGLWDHSAAGHVDEGEDYITAAYRELKEEVGVEGVQLKEELKMYTEEPERGKIKKRFNKLYSGVYDGAVVFDPGEVAETKWIKPEELLAWVNQQPADFTPDFVSTYKELLKHK